MAQDNVSGQCRVGIDIGGTFTDLFLSRPGGGASALHKTLTTPDDPARGALTGLTELLEREGLPMSALDEIVHGTTLVTNAVIERNGARVGLLTTTGFRDTLEIGNEQRYDIYDLDLAFPEPLVSRDLVFEVSAPPETFEAARRDMERARSSLRAVRS